MIFNMYEHELMKLCGICRYLPTGLLRKYDAPYLSRSVIVGLQKFGVIKTQSDKGSYKLTTKGRDYLAEMGFEFSDDIRMDLKRPIYKRKLKNAFWNITLSLAGIDIYHSRTRELAEKDVGYVSSLVIRADKCTKVLAGTKFLGISQSGAAILQYSLQTVWLRKRRCFHLLQERLQATARRNPTTPVLLCTPRRCCSLIIRSVSY